MEVMVNAGQHESGMPVVVVEVTDEFTQFKFAFDADTARNVAAGLTQMSIIAEEAAKQ